MASRSIRIFATSYWLGLVIITCVSNCQGQLVGIDLGLDNKNRPIFKEDVSEVTLDIVRSQVREFHQRNVHLLDVGCFASDCPFSRARQIIGDVVEATKYWSFINCIKFGETCPVNGGWTHWSKHTQCSARCGKGHTVYRRNCTFPNPLYGGPSCAGSDHKLVECFVDEGLNCTLDPSLVGAWGQWSKWSQCRNNTKQGRFVRRRNRQCLPSLKDEDCEAFGEESRKCGLTLRNVDGGWSNWLPWSDCSMKHICGHGVRIRKRTCSNPYRHGEGADCAGASSETTPCEGPKCARKTEEITHLLPDSFLRYSRMPPSYFLNIYLKFFPDSNGGTLFQYSNQAALQEATKSGNVKVKKPTLPQFINADSKEDEYYEVAVNAKVNPFIIESFILAELDSPTDVKVQVTLNGSQEIRIPLTGVKQSKWNELRVLAVSNKVVCRLNDGENVESIVEEIVSDENTLGVETVDGAVNDVFFNILGVRKRQIFSYFDGEIGVGYVRNGLPGFRGYISKLTVNYKQFTLKETPRSQIRKYWDPVQIHSLSYSSGNLARTSAFQHFNGKGFTELLLTGSWIRQTSLQPEFGTMNGDVTTFEFLIIPECKDGIFFYLESEKNPLTHWKLFVEQHRRVRFVMSYGGEITILTSNDDLYISRWNKVILQLVSRGFAHLQVNAHSYTTSLPNAELEHTPKRFAHVGGFGKSIEHDTLLGTEPSDELRAQFKSFTGYIYSVKVNDRLYYVKDMRRLNTFRMISSDFTVTVKSLHEVLFLPSSSDEIVEESADVLIPQQTSRHQRYRSITCHVPKVKGEFDKPNVEWYFNDVNIERSSVHWTTEQDSNESHTSYLYFGSVVDGTALHSGVYTCVATFFGNSHLIAIFVVAVLPEEIARANSGKWFIWNVSKDTAILLICIIVACALVVLLMLLALIKTIYRKILKSMKKRGDKAESMPLTKIRPTKSDVKSNRSSRQQSNDRRMHSSERKSANFKSAAKVAVYAGRLREILQNASFNDSEQEFNDSEQEFNDSEQEFNDSEQEFNDSEEEFNDSEEEFLDDQSAEEFEMNAKIKSRRARSGSTNFETKPLIK